MPNPKAPRVKRRPDPFPAGRLVAIGAGDVVDYWREVVASLDSDTRADLYAEWAAMSDDELARDVLAPIGDLPDSSEAVVEWVGVDDVPKLAAKVVEWIGDDPARARLALDVEGQRSAQRVTVLDAARSVLGG